MVIVCPACATSYAIRPGDLGESGRNVRCTRCETNWFAEPEQPEPAMAEAEQEAAPALVTVEPDAPIEMVEAPMQEAAIDLPAQEAATIEHAAQDILPAETAAPSIIPDDPQDNEGSGFYAGEPEPAPPSRKDIESYAALRTRKQVRRRDAVRRHHRVLLIVGLVAVIGALVGWRRDIVRVAPQTAGLYASIGLPVNLRGLVFTDVRTTRETHDGVPVLVVEGNIASASSGAREVPRLRFAVRGNDGSEIYSWTALPVRSVLAPGETLPFRSRLASPPVESRDILVRFHTRRDSVASVR